MKYPFKLVETEVGRNYVVEECPLSRICSIVVDHAKITDCPNIRVIDFKKKLITCKYRKRRKVKSHDMYID